MVVFLKVSEEANCEYETVCQYTWTTDIPVLETVSVEFDETSYTWQYKVTGVNFTGDTSTTELYFGEYKQDIVSVTETEAVFTISNVSSSTIDATETRDTRLYFDVGLPENYTLTYEAFEITPKFVSVHPKTGSYQGTIITLTAPGVHVNSNVDVVDADGASICNPDYPA